MFAEFTRRFARTHRTERRASFQSTMQLLSELSPKFCELARTDSLPDPFHGVKEERQIMVGQEDAREHLAGLIKMADESAGMTMANGTFTRFVKRILIQGISRIFDIQFAARCERRPVLSILVRQNELKNL